MNHRPNKKHIITIAGRPGSGKSSTAKLVAQSLGFDHFSSGDLFRQIGRELGLDVVQVNLSAEQNKEIDERVDGRLRQIGQTKDRIVIDSRTAWHWIPASFKVFLDLDLETAAHRILSELTEERKVSETVAAHPEEYAALLRHRLELEARRYRALYDIDPYDTGNYDLVVDTAKHDLQQAVSLVVDSFKDWLKTN
jgi:cytidylate kinase